jgi:N-acetylglucosaminyldiphosphoundecaprenol N-acetyl-beta-D-mannosaminyltransferase
MPEIPTVPLTGPILNSAYIGDLPVTLASHEAILGEIARVIASGEKGRHVAITNTETLYHTMHVPDYARFIRDSSFSLCDGVGVIVAGWAWGADISRFNGPVFQLKASEYGVGRGWRHFYYGGKEGVAEKMAERLQAQFPGMIVCGSYCPPFRKLSAAEEEDVIARINATRPDFVWVSLGMPQKELWIQRHLGRIDAAFMCGVGGAFDFHAGAIPWAPAPLRFLGLEWLYRLIVEPKLRAKRLWWSVIGMTHYLRRGVARFMFLRSRQKT